jgi:hypothetical protein
MQAGKQRGALPLIRKFNEHSERLLKSAMCVWPTLSSHSDSEDISIGPWTSLANGEELIPAMQMMCVVFPDIHVDGFPFRVLLFSGA